MTSMAFYHPDRGYWETDGVPDANLRAAYPNGTVKVPFRPSDNHQWQEGAWVFVEKVPTAEELAAKLAKWRSTATLSRAQFCTRAFRAGLLPKADAIAAAKGEWPPSFDAALAGLPENIKIEAQIEWAAVNEIRRDADTLVFVQAAEQIDDAQIDALFGWKET